MFQTTNQGIVYPHFLTATDFHFDFNQFFCDEGTSQSVDPCQTGAKTLKPNSAAYSNLSQSQEDIPANILLDINFQKCAAV